MNRHAGAVTRSDVVIGVDLGTTSTKAIAFDTGGRQLATASAGYPLAEPHPGWAEQDPHRSSTRCSTRSGTVVSEVDGPVAGLSFSSAMHTLIGLDAAGTPLTPSLSWADSRASRAGRAAAGRAGGLALHRRTGTPMHPMAPLPKLMWFREQQPELFDRVACWVGIKDYVLSRMCGALVTDHSVASGTGLLDLGTLSWDARGAAAGRHRARAAAGAGAGHDRAARAVARGRRPARAAAGAHRWSSVPATGRWPTSASARCTLASRRARSAPAARCG